jgi:hypothetical protein
MGDGHVGLEKVTTRNPEGGRYTRDTEDDSLRHMRRQRDKETYAELTALRETNTEHLKTIHSLTIEIEMLRSEHEVDRVKQDNEVKLLRSEFESYVNRTEQAIVAAQTVANAGFIGKNVIYAIVSITAAIGGVVAVSELIKKWLHHS